MFKIVDAQTFDVMISQGQWNLLTGSIDNDIQITIPYNSSGINQWDDGVMVSCWVKYKEAHPGRIKSALVISMHSCLGIGFGSRPCSISRGSNFYYGL